MEAVKKIKNGMNAVLSFLCIILFAFMVCVGTYQIVTRFVFNSPSTVSEELLTYSFAWMALLSSALVFGKRDHMRMGFWADKLTGTKKKVLELVIAASVMVYGGSTIMKLTMTQKTASLGIPMGIIYTVVPLSGIVIVIYAILNMIELCKGNLDQPVAEEK